MCTIMVFVGIEQTDMAILVIYFHIALLCIVGDTSNYWSSDGAKNEHETIKPSKYAERSTTNE